MNFAVWRNWGWMIILNHRSIFFPLLMPSIYIFRGNEKIILYACDCSNETLERAKEFVAASNVISVEHRFHPFYCDFATTGFPKCLACDYCREMFALKGQNYLSGSYLSCFFHLFLPQIIRFANIMNLNSLFFSLPDIREKRTHETDICCVGGVDFITLVCIFNFINVLIVNANRHLNFLGNKEDSLVFFFPFPLSICFFAYFWDSTSCCLNCC